MSRAAQQEPTTPGRELRVGRARLEIKIDPAVAPSQFFAFESTLPPGGGMPYLHLHHEMEEAFSLLEGTIEYIRGDQTILATAGSMVQIPPGVAHKFRNVGTAQARHLAVTTPGMAGLRVMEVSRLCSVMSLRVWSASPRDGRDEAGADLVPAAHLLRGGGVCGREDLEDPVPPASGTFGSGQAPSVAAA